MRCRCDLAIHPDALALIDGAQAADGAGETADGADEASPVHLSTEHVKLVELNCFYPATGMGLFDYWDDAERLTQGPFEWRVRTEPLPKASVKLEKEWRQVLQGQDGGARGGAAGTRRYTDAAWAQLDSALSAKAANKEAAAS